MVALNPKPVSTLLLRAATYTMLKGGALSCIFMNTTKIKVDPILSTMIIDRDITTMKGTFYQDTIKGLVTALDPQGIFKPHLDK